MMFNNKKGMSWVDAWGEVLTTVFLIFGLLVSILVDSSLVSYIVILISGFMVGRVYHMRRHKIGVPFFLIIIGYLVGYILGAAIRDRGHWFFLLIFFAIGAMLGEFIHKRKYCK